MGLSTSRLDEKLSNRTLERMIFIHGGSRRSTSLPPTHTFRIIGNDMWTDSNVSPTIVTLDKFTYSLLEGQVTPDTDHSVLYSPDSVQPWNILVYPFFFDKRAPSFLTLETTAYGACQYQRHRFRHFDGASSFVAGWTVQWTAGLVAMRLLLSLFTASAAPRRGIVTIYQSKHFIWNRRTHRLHSIPAEADRYSGDAAMPTLRRCENS